MHDPRLFPKPMIVGFHQRMLGVYVEIGRKAMVSGNVGVHQFVRIGELAMIGGLTMVTQDFPPYFMLDNRGLCVGINRITHEAVKRRRLCRFLKRVERPLRLGRFSSFNKLRYQKVPVREAILQGTETLVRPITMTALAAILGLQPAAFSTQIGSQSQRPLAIVVVGGMLSTLVFFNLVPLLYSYYGHREPLVGVGHGHD